MYAQRCRHCAGTGLIDVEQFHAYGSTWVGERICEECATCEGTGLLPDDAPECHVCADWIDDEPTATDADGFTIHAACATEETP